jgi:2-polyprenyl-3-methyl-5-hydroxy-6-metoxy-1,4-benzoquinol methylase
MFRCDQDPQKAQGTGTEKQLMEHNDSRSAVTDSDTNYYIREQLEYVNAPATRKGWKLRYEFASQHVREGDSVLDCGCGLGQGTQMLFDRSGKAAGVDIDTRFIDYCRLHCTKCRFSCLDVSHNLPFPNEHFDVVVAIELLEHMPSGNAVRRALTNIQRVLKPGGFLVASAPNRRIGGGAAILRLVKHSILKIAGMYVKKQARWHEHYIIWTPEIFRSVLLPYFESISVFGQGTDGITQETNRAPYLLARARKHDRTPAS